MSDGIPDTVYCRHCANAKRSAAGLLIWPVEFGMNTNRIAKKEIPQWKRLRS